ncbi:hypothetical protein LTR78_004747 [Recurvomyces mirabilis]|uniref:NAD(P)-binding protein n=1 Tax=Recurvomyces mirabilis TaxID=574656 RepID=A0AAE0WP00_9PEZI|nr:hypothetical protein LTR78_004747 [Recurvomyces mirabilis]
MSAFEIITGFLPHLFYSQFFVTPKYPFEDLTGKTVIVTGANTGLGKEAARHFVRLNAEKVIIACRTVEKGEAAKNDIERSTGRTGVIEVWKLDLQDYDNVKAFAKKAEGLKRLDIVIENAGINTSKFVKAGGNESTITVNVTSTFLLALLLLPKLQQSGKVNAVTPTLTILPEKSAPSVFETLNDEKTARSTLRDLEAPGSVCLSRDCTPASYRPARRYDQLRHELAREIDSAVFRAITRVFCRTTEVGSRTLVNAGLSGKETHGKYLSDDTITPCAPLVEGKGGAELQSKIWRELVGQLEGIQPGITKVLEV